MFLCKDKEMETICSGPEKSMQRLWTKSSLSESEVVLCLSKNSYQHMGNKNLIKLIWKKTKIFQQPSITKWIPKLEAAHQEEAAQMHQLNSRKQVECHQPLTDLQQEVKNLDSEFQK